MKRRSTPRLLVRQASALKCRGSEMTRVRPITRRSSLEPMPLPCHVWLFPCARTGDYPHFLQRYPTGQHIISKIVWRPCYTHLVEPPIGWDTLMRCPRRVTDCESLHSTTGKRKHCRTPHPGTSSCATLQAHKVQSISDGLAGSRARFADLLHAAPEFLIAVYLSSSAPIRGPNNDA